MKKLPSNCVSTLTSIALIRWNEILDDMYGDEEARKGIILQMALEDEHVSPAAKAWLSSLPKSP